MRPFRRRLACLLVVSAVLAVGQRFYAQSLEDFLLGPVDLAGTYQVEAGGLADQEYTGTLEIKKRKRVTSPLHGQLDLWNLNWALTLHDKSEIKLYGIGFRVGRRLFAAYGPKGSGFTLWLYDQSVYTREEREAIIAKHDEAVDKKQRGGGIVNDRSLLQYMKPTDNLLGFGVAMDDRRSELATAGGQVRPVEGRYDERTVFVKDDGKRSDTSGNFGGFTVLVEGETLTIKWSGSDSRSKKYEVPGTGIDLGDGSFVAIQGGSYGEDSAGGVFVYDFQDGKLVGRYADNGATIRLYKEIVKAPQSVVARAPALWR